MLDKKILWIPVKKFQKLALTRNNQSWSLLCKPEWNFWILVSRVPLERREKENFSFIMQISEGKDSSGKIISKSATVCVQIFFWWQPNDFIITLVWNSYPHIDVLPAVCIIMKKKINDAAFVIRRGLHTGLVVFQSPVVTKPETDAFKQTGEKKYTQNTSTQAWNVQCTTERRTRKAVRQKIKFKLFVLI